MRAITLSIISALLLSLSTMSVSADNLGANLSDQIINYQRQSPAIATGGLVSTDAMNTLKKQGFKTIVDLRTPKEGVKKEHALAEANGLAYYNLPVAKAFPDASMRAQFKRLVEDPANHPVLVHCGSANRVGMVWAAYQLDQGASFEAAVAEGRAIGMKPSKEKQLVEYYQSKPKAAVVISGE